MTWDAVVMAPQGGPIHTHHFEGSDPATLLREIAEALDLSRADGVEISLKPISDEAEHARSFRVVPTRVE